MIIMFHRPYDQIKTVLEDYVKELYDIKEEMIWSRPPSSSFGDLSFPLFALAKKLQMNPQKLGATLKSRIKDNHLVEKASVERGFLNLFFNKKHFSSNVIKTVLDDHYTNLSLKSEEKIMIEHTSSNPNNPLHIGNFRGSVIGDVLGRIYRLLGAKVNVRYYINDLGKQIAPVVIGYFLLKNHDIKPDVKIDFWIGQIYASMNTMLEIQILKKDLLSHFKEQKIIASNVYYLENQEYSSYVELLAENTGEEDLTRLLERLEKNYQVQNSLLEKIPDIYQTLQKLILSEVKDLYKKTENYVQAYLKGSDKDIIAKFREVTTEALSGHITTLKLFNIHHDDFDRESDIAWMGEVSTILQTLEEKGWLRHDGKARLLKSDEVASSLRFKEKYLITHEIPEAILVNSKGVPLYPCRDIAYHLHKFDDFAPTKCYNVIGKQQQFPQLIVRIALYALNKKELADKIVHFDYEYVTLIGRKMAGRELEYVTPDEVYDLTSEEAFKIIQDRDFNDNEREEIVRAIASSSVKYSILNMDPQKNVVFDVKKATDLNANSGPFLQYAYTRAKNILKKASEFINDIIKTFDNEKIIVEEENEWILIKLIERLPFVYKRAVENLRPDVVANYAFELCQAFNKFYETCHVIGAETEGQKIFRLVLVHSYVKCMESLFDAMGLEKLDKM